MQKYLIFEDGKSHKFWTISTDNNSFTVVFGKVGTQGQTQTKTFASTVEAETEALKQANAKIKKGYAEAEPPADFAVNPDRGKTSAAGAAKPLPEKEVVPAEKLAPVKDDGEPKPWHNDEWWQYSWYCPDEERFADLSQPDEDDEAIAEPAPEPVKAETADQEIIVYNWGDRDEHDDDDDDDDEYDVPGTTYSLKSGFVRMCRRGHLTEAREKWALLKERQAAGDKEASEQALQAQLDEAVTDIMDSYSLKDDKIAVLQWLLEQGANMCDEDDCDTGIAKFIYVQYVENKVKPAEITALYDGYCEKAVAGLASQYADNILEMAEYLKTGQKRAQSHIKSEAPEGGWPEDCCGMGLYFSEDTFSIYAIKPGCAGERWLSVDYDATDGIETVRLEPIVREHLTPLLERMAREGVFSDLGPAILKIAFRKGATLLKVTLDEAKAKTCAQRDEALVQMLETSDDLGTNAALLNAGVAALMEGVYMPEDYERGLNLILRYLYSADEKAEEAAKDLLDYYDDMDERSRFADAMWQHANFNFYWAKQRMASLAEAGYAPAVEKLDEFKREALARAKALKKDGGGKTKKQDVRYSSGAKKAAAFKQVFTPADVFIQTDNIMARADAGGTIRVRFLIEGEAGYGEALDFINNLLEKGYGDMFGGLTLLVRFVAEPMFIKPLKGDFAPTSCHAFFAKAVQYPALREKVKYYADLALVEFNWYHDLDGEENTVPGTFAACALAFADESYIHMAGQYGRESDDEHQYIQLAVPPALVKQYGVTPVVATVFFDIAASNGQDGYLKFPKELYTDPANLAAIMEHCEKGYYDDGRQLNWFVTRYTEAMISSKPKTVLKKLKELADAVDTPEAKNIYIDYYNFYKRYASEEHNTDLGDDLESVAEKKAVVVPQYPETTPVVMALKEAEKKGLVDAETSIYPKGKKYCIFFTPGPIANPYDYDFRDDQWQAMCKAPIAAGFFWGKSKVVFGDWVVDLAAAPHEYGVICYDGKNKPVMLYGFLNTAPLMVRFYKRSFKTPEDYEVLRQAHLIQEAPPKRATTTADRPSEKALEDIYDAVLNERFYAAGVLLTRYAPDNDYYLDTALIMKLKVAEKKIDIEAQKELCAGLLQRQPEFADYWNKKLGKLS